MKGHCHAQSLLQLLCDDLTGDADRNVIHGGPNGDVLYGLDGNDRLFGDAGIGNASRDIVTDFGVNADRINLAVIDSNTIIAGNQTFSFIGAGAFTNVAGQLRFTASPSFQTTLVEGDVNGDGHADFQIMLQGNLILAATDFFL